MVLKCSHSGRFTFVYWIKLTEGLKPQRVAIKNRYAPPKACPEFEESTRFNTAIADGVFHLSISDVQPSDAAAYHCVVVNSNGLEFAGGTLLTLKGNTSFTPGLKWLVESHLIPV